MRSLLEHQVVERLAVELAAEVDVDLAVSAALEHETTQRLVAAIVASPGLDQLMVQATDRVLRGPELQRVVEHVASSPEVRDALTAAEHDARDRARRRAAHPGRDARRRRRTHGARMVATAAPRLSAPYAGIATRGIALAVDAALANLIVLLIAALVASSARCSASCGRSGSSPWWPPRRWPLVVVSTSRCSGRRPARRRGCG